MRGVEPTVMLRVYRSDNDRFTRDIAAWRAYNPGHKKIYRADAVRRMVEENVRLKKRNRYLEMEIAGLLAQVNELKRNTKTVYR